MQIKLILLGFLVVIILCGIFSEIQVRNQKKAKENKKNKSAVTSS